MLAHRTTTNPDKPPASAIHHGCKTQGRPAHSHAPSKDHTPLSQLAAIHINSNRIATQPSTETSEPAGGCSHVPSSGDTGPCTSRSFATLRAATTRRCARPRPRPVATPPPEPPARRAPPPPPAAKASGREAVASCSGGEAEAFVAIAARVQWSAARCGRCDAMTSSRGRGKSRGALKISPPSPLPCRATAGVRGRARVVPLVCGPTSGPGTPVGGRVAHDVPLCEFVSLCPHFNGRESSCFSKPIFVLFSEFRRLEMTLPLS